ncbi:MAG: class I SAM-dependent methyltransferase [Deltaproteobacteria bacterium]|nr:class I SAM-dependent methyltransferase [Deltaproteobacteria bacterium]
MMNDSKVIKNCQICGSVKLKSILSLGYMPPPSDMHINTAEMKSYPLHLVQCLECSLFQLDCIVNRSIVFPKDFPYTSSTTKVLRDNFLELFLNCQKRFQLNMNDLVIDIGSNDGNLLSFFKNHSRVLGVTPEDIGTIAIEKGISTILDFFSLKLAKKIRQKEGPAKIITATNVLAHVDDLEDFMSGVLECLDERGLFIAESHWFLPLIERLQYDTIYHEHLRFYTLKSLISLMERFDLDVFDAEKIKPHGGSLRIYVSRKGMMPIHGRVKKTLHEEDECLSIEALESFRHKVLESKCALHVCLQKIIQRKATIYGIGAAARATTLIHFTGLDHQLIDCVLEVKGSAKIGKYIPGTFIPVFDEDKLYRDQPQYALILSWHIADTLIPILKNRGFKGDFIVPLPYPKVIRQ